MKKIKLNFVGPIEDENYFSNLRKNNTVKFYSPVKGQELQNFISKFDIFLMPYKLETHNTKATVPAKLFQYLACGRPIVSSKLDNLIKLPPKFIYSSCDANEFIENIYKAKMKIQKISILKELNLQAIIIGIMWEIN